MKIIEDIIECIHCKMRDIGNIIDDRDMHNIPFYEYVKEYEKLEMIKNYLTKENQTKKFEGNISLEYYASIAHEQWSGWMKYLFEKSTKNKDGTVTIPKWAVDRWTRQMNTEYIDLSEDEKKSDRIEAKKYIE